MNAVAITDVPVARPMTETAPSTRGRIIATLYLFVFAAGVVAQVFIADRLVVGGSAAATAANIIANRSLYRLGFTIFMLEMVAQVVVTTMFYDLLKPVNRSVSRISMVIGLTGCGIKTMSRLFCYAPLILLGAPAFSAIEPAQLATVSLAFIRINDQGAAIALIFFGFETVLGGWLVFRSGFLPRFLGVVSTVGGLGWLTYLWPPLGSQVLVVVALFAIAGVMTTAGWLLIRGVDDSRWHARAALAANSQWR